MNSVVQDVTYTLRTLPRALGFTVAAVITLALGIGANTAIFSIVDSVLLRPLPYRQADRLVSLWIGGGGTAAEFAAIRDRTRSYKRVAAYQPDVGFTLASSGAPERINGTLATSALFSVLGVPPMLGRTFAANEDHAGNDRVAVLAYAVWQQRFGGDPHIVGRTVTLDGVPRTIIGVMPADFRFPLATTQAWVPLVSDTLNLGAYWGSGGDRILARLRPGATIPQAQVELRGLSRSLRHDNPLWDPGAAYGTAASVVSLQAEAAGDVRTTLLILFAAVGAVLLIACVNVANLLLARGMSQSKAIAIRAALGARRVRLIQQLVTESVVLSAIGAAVGFLIASAVVAPLANGLLANTARLSDVRLDVGVLVYTAVIAAVAGIASGLLPAFRTSDSNLQSLLKSGSRGTSDVKQRKLSDALIVAEVALAVMLVIGAGLLIRSFWELRNTDPGFRPGGVVTAQVDLPRARYAQPVQQRAFYSTLLARLGALPGTVGVSATSELPLVKSSGLAFRVQGQFEDIRHGLPMSSGYHVVAPRYAHTMGIPVLAGRDFTTADNAGGQDVAIVSEALAHHYWPHGSAIGQRIGYPWESPWLTIVGVVGNVRERNLAAPDTDMTIYRPVLQAPNPTMTIVMRSSASPDAAVAGVRRVVAALDRTVPISNIRTMDAVVSSAVAKPRFTMILLSAFAGVALILGAVGIYGVISYSVTQRNREIGIRMTLGAKRWDVLNLIVRRGAILGAVGAIAGLLASLAAMRALASQLYGVSTFDPMIYLVAPFLLIAVAILASYVPARRATGLDPTVVLNGE